MSTRESARLVKFEIKRNSHTETVWARVSKRALVKGKVKSGNFVSFSGGKEFWEILSAKRLSIFNKPSPDARIYAAASFREA